MRNLTNKHLPVLHSYRDLKRIFAENSTCTVFKENRNLKKILSPSLHATVDIEKYLIS